MSPEEFFGERCEHREEDLRIGPRVEARWGSVYTQICKCGMWRTLHHKPGVLARWSPSNALSGRQDNAMTRVNYLKVREALENSQGLLVAILNEERPVSEIEAQIAENRAALTPGFFEGSSVVTLQERQP